MFGIGNPAPAFTLHNQDKESLSLDQLRGKWVVIYIYPKDDTPGCTKEACGFSESLEGFEKLGVTVVGISPDSPDSHMAFKQKHNLKITLLSDEKKEVIQLYEALGTQEGKEAVIRSTFLIDPHGTIRYIWRYVNVDGHIEEVKKIIEEQQKEG